MFRGDGVALLQGQDMPQVLAKAFSGTKMAYQGRAASMNHF